LRCTSAEPFFAERDSHLANKYRIVRTMTRSVTKRTKVRRIYQGSCHCRRLGALWQEVPEQDLEVLAGGENLSLYQFGTRTAQHYFCRHCGIAPFSRPRTDPSRWAVNLRCLEDLELSRLTIESCPS